MSDVHEQLGIPDDWPTEHIRGGAPADPADFEAAKQAWYARLGSADACLPEHDVHIYELGPCVGSCRCGARRPPKGER